MARKYATNIDLQGNQIQGLVLETLTGDPVTVVTEGRLYYNAANGNKRPVVYDGTAWRQFSFRDELDAAMQGLAPKDSVRVATTAALGGTYANGTNGVGATLTFGAALTIDGVAIAAGDRILVKDQAAAAQNGIYDATSTTVLTRSTDANVWEELRGAMVYVEDGTANAGALWTCACKKGGTIDGAQAVTWTIFQRAADITFGGGLQKSGNAVSIADNGVTNAKLADMAQNRLKGRVTASTGDPEDLTPAQARQVISSDVSGSRLSLGQSILWSTATTTFTATHNLNTTAVTFEVVEVATGNIVEVDCTAVAANTISLSANPAPAANAWRVNVWS